MVSQCRRAEQMKINLTDASVAAARCPAGKKDLLLFDATQRGFGIRVSAAGETTFLFQYKITGQVRRMSLGRFGLDLTTAAARRQAEKLRGQVLAGADPIGEQRARQAATLQAEAEARAAKAAAAYTVQTMVDQWAALKLSERSASYAARAPKEVLRPLKAWRNVSAESLGHADAVRVLDDVKTRRGPVAANRFRAMARACWSWAMKRGALPANPWDATPRPAEERARERVLDDWELGALWNAAASLDARYCSIVRLLLLTGQRRDEVAAMAWEELDLSARLWRLPGERTKNHRSNVVPLCAEAVAMLTATRQVRREGASLVFEGRERTAATGFGKAKLRLDTAMTKLAAEAGRKLPPWTLHDIRRSVATGFQRLGVRLEVTEATLNHVSGSRAGIVGVYQTYGWDTEKVAALNAWAAHVLACASHEAMPDKVVALRPKRAGRSAVQ